VSLSVKICGLNAPEAVTAAIEGGAFMVGFIFYARSPRALDPEAAGKLASMVPEGIGRVGVIVNEDDRRIGEILSACKLNFLQLHGEESPERCQEIRERHGLPVIKVIKVAEPGDLDAAKDYGDCAEFLFFDAKAPATLVNALPGGNAISFDWTMLKGRRFDRPWLLSGGLTAANLGQAVAATGARIVDVSSGVEDRPGVKNPSKIKEFLAAADGIGKP